jgi:hypothetical protein
MNIPGTLRRYDIEPEELACIALFIHCESQTFAWDKTIGINKNSKQPGVMGSRFFNKPEIQQYLFDWKEKQNRKGRGTFDTKINNQKEPPINSEDSDIEITSDNIKQILQSEFQSIKDPDKRAVILMKIADFVGLKNSDADDPLTPTIYLPARCSTCNQLKTKV